MKKGLIWFCRIFVGLLFIFSGLIKINDPLGFSYKLVEYFEVFHITFLNGLALSLSIILCALEIIMGFALLIGVRAKQTVWGILLLIIFFSFLTFYSAAFKVVQTCGCFGDAIPLTPWQSFSKDVILLLLILVLFKNKENIKPLFSAKTGDNLLIGATIVSLGFGLFTYNFLPVVDFLPYKVGANIPEAMKTPPGAIPDEYQVNYNLKNKKTGESKDVTDKEYLSSGIWKDNNWEVIGNPESKLIKKGFTPKIQDLIIKDAQGNDYTQDLLANPFNSLFIVAYDLSKTDTAAIIKINALAINLTRSFNTRTILLTSAASTEAEAFAKRYHLISEIFYADGVPLKSMVRANPGVMLLKAGTVLNKWHYHTVPGYDDIVKQYFPPQ
jgi:uncharacterized membrane protein YphA (DoxX/SURF4 family)